MPKNLNTIERSERIRVGKNVPDEQAINTVLINASNSVVEAPISGFYVAPIRYDTSVLSNTLVYNTVTKEIVDAGISADNQTLQDVTDYGLTTNNVVEFINTTTAFTTISNVGIANTSPIHTLDVGSNVYFDDTASNVLTVLGNVSLQRDVFIEGNLAVRGTTTLVHSENLSIKDPIIVLGENNTDDDFVFDLGVVMARPDSNVAVGYIENDDELVLAYTTSDPSGRYIVPDSSNTLNVHVYGSLFTDSNVGIANTSPIHTLDIGSNVYVDDTASNILVVHGDAKIDERLYANTVSVSDVLDVTGTIYALSNVDVCAGAERERECVCVLKCGCISGPQCEWCCLCPLKCGCCAGTQRYRECVRTLQCGCCAGVERDRKCVCTLQC
jgi:hypothetical protein